MFDKHRESLAASKSYQKVKLHLQENKRTYLVGAGGAAFAGITCLIVRGAASHPISSSVTGTASSNVIGTGKKVVIGNVSFISAERQGPPSWVVRCKETGAIFTSQRMAAFEMGLAQTNISKQLNGLQENAQGYHFERICLAG